MAPLGGMGMGMGGMGGMGMGPQGAPKDSNPPMMMPHMIPSPQQQAPNLMGMGMGGMGGPAMGMAPNGMFYPMQSPQFPQFYMGGGAPFMQFPNAGMMQPMQAMMQPAAMMQPQQGPPQAAAPAGPPQLSASMQFIPLQSAMSGLAGQTPMSMAPPVLIPQDNNATPVAAAGGGKQGGSNDRSVSQAEGAPSSVVHNSAGANVSQPPTATPTTTTSAEPAKPQPKQPEAKPAPTTATGGGTRVAQEILGGTSTVKINGVEAEQFSPETLESMQRALVQQLEAQGITGSQVDISAQPGCVLLDTSCRLPMAAAEAGLARGQRVVNVLAAVPPALRACMHVQQVRPMVCEHAQGSMTLDFPALPITAAGVPFAFTVSLSGPAALLPVDTNKLKALVWSTARRAPVAVDDAEWSTLKGKLRFKGVLPLASADAVVIRAGLLGVDGHVSHVFPWQCHAPVVPAAAAEELAAHPRLAFDVAAVLPQVLRGTRVTWDAAEAVTWGGVLQEVRGDAVQARCVHTVDLLASPAPTTARTSNANALPPPATPAAATPAAYAAPSQNTAACAPSTTCTTQTAFLDRVGASETGKSVSGMAPSLRYTHHPLPGKVAAAGAATSPADAGTLSPLKSSLPHSSVVSVLQSFLVTLDGLGTPSVPSVFFHSIAQRALFLHTHEIENPKFKHNRYGGARKFPRPSGRKFLLVNTPRRFALLPLPF